MKVVHYTQFNASGMNRVAESIVQAERAMGCDSHLLNIFDEQDWSVAFDADIHVAHTHFPDFKNGSSFRRMLKKPPKIVAFFHGTPEFVFGDTVGSFRRDGHWAGDGLQMLYHWLKVADARVTHWPRHQAIYQSLVDRGTVVDCIPMGIDHEYWGGGSNAAGRWAGDPCVFSAENPHFIKWPFDLITAWRWVYPQLENAVLHCGYLAEDLHRTFGPWITNTGAGYGMRWSATMWNHAALRDIFKSVHVYAGLVKCGDFNHISLQASVAGTTTISYRGNPYSDYWVTEGDQREIARELLAILRGDVKPREKSPVPHIADTAEALRRIYERLSVRTIVPGFELPFAPCASWTALPGVAVDLREPPVISKVAVQCSDPQAFADAMNALPSAATRKAPATKSATRTRRRR